MGKQTKSEQMTLWVGSFSESDIQQQVIRKQITYGPDLLAQKKKPEVNQKRIFLLPAIQMIN